MKIPEKIIEIDGRLVGDGQPTYFIADIAANHDGDLQRAKDLIYLAAENGADAAKFQHFQAQTIVSDAGFREIKSGSSHQAKWKKSVFEVYRDASIDLSWTIELKNTCEDAGITFFTSPYSEELLNYIDEYVPAHKIGSGDITWLEMLRLVAKKNKPTFIACGASSFDDVVAAMETILPLNTSVCLMQCNTNYTASLENFKYIQLNVLQAFRQMYPNLILGLSDHTPGHSTVLGAVALGARAIEKHLTDDNGREGPDHRFSMNGKTWREMVCRTRELENAMGDGVKRVEKNEIDTVVLQRRAVYVSRDLPAGHVLKRDDLICLRPCPENAIAPNKVEYIVGKTLAVKVGAGERFKWQHLASPS